jgi:hypothetical protein
MGIHLTHRDRGRRNLRRLLHRLVNHLMPVGALEQREAAITGFLTHRHRCLALLGSSYLFRVMSGDVFATLVNSLSLDPATHPAEDLFLIACAVAGGGGQGDLAELGAFVALAGLQAFQFVVAADALVLVDEIGGFDF